jgi:hypothetical protein
MTGYSEGGTVIQFAKIRCDPLGGPERFWRKETTMASSTTPARLPERSTEAPKASRPEKKTTRFVIKIGGVIPT